MVRRSHKRRKRFSCGHLGFGRFCHHCDRVVHIDATLPLTTKIGPLSKLQPRSRRVWKAAAHQKTKRRWQASFAHDPIDLSHLPKPIVIKTRCILASLDRGVSPKQLRGKRFNFDRTLLRIPISYRYRLLCRWLAGQIVPLQVLSHEAYNPISRNKKRLRGS